MDSLTLILNVNVTVFVKRKKIVMMTMIMLPVQKVCFSHSKKHSLPFLCIQFKSQSATQGQKCLSSVQRSEGKIEKMVMFLRPSVLSCKRSN